MEELITIEQSIMRNKNLPQSGKAAYCTANKTTVYNVTEH